MAIDFTDSPPYKAMMTEWRQGETPPLMCKVFYNEHPVEEDYRNLFRSFYSGRIYPSIYPEDEDRFAELRLQEFVKRLLDPFEASADPPTWGAVAMPKTRSIAPSFHYDPPHIYWHHEVKGGFAGWHVARAIRHTEWIATQLGAHIKEVWNANH